jgi:hypothetical protein
VKKYELSGEVCAGKMVIAGLNFVASGAVLAQKL